MKNLFGSVIYDDAMPFFNTFLESLSRQTMTDFEILLINDGVPVDLLEEMLSGLCLKYKIISYDVYYTPIQLRIKLLEEAKIRKADILIMGDADDYFSDNRIDEIVRVFQREPACGFVYNELSLFDGSRVMPELPEIIQDVTEILNYNFLGLSNTALNLRRLSENFLESLKECDTYVFDWYLFSRLLIKGEKGKKALDAYTYYRIYDGNVAGITQMSYESVSKEIAIKLKHYRLLEKYDDIFRGLADAYARKNVIYHYKQKSYYWWDLTREEKHEI